MVPTEFQSALPFASRRAGDDRGLEARGIAHEGDDEIRRDASGYDVFDSRCDER